MRRRSIVADRTAQQASFVSVEPIVPVMRRRRHRRSVGRLAAATGFAVPAGLFADLPSLMVALPLVLFVAFQVWMCTCTTADEICVVASGSVRSATGAEPGRLSVRSGYVSSVSPAECCEIITHPLQGGSRLGTEGAVWVDAEH
jgi:hypothetical protein